MPPFLLSANKHASRRELSRSPEKLKPFHSLSNYSQEIEMHFCKLSFEFRKHNRLKCVILSLEGIIAVKNILHSIFVLKFTCLQNVRFIYLFKYLLKIALHSTDLLYLVLFRI